MQDGELLDPVICLLDQDTSKPKVFVHGKKGSQNKIYEVDDEQLSFCSCVNDHDDNGGHEDDDCGGPAASDCCGAKPPETPDYERDAIRDDLMAMKGGVKLLGEQNKYLLSRLDGSVILRAISPPVPGVSPVNPFRGRIAPDQRLFFTSNRNLE